MLSRTRAPIKNIIGFLVLTAQHLLKAMQTGPIFCSRSPQDLAGEVCNYSTFSPRQLCRKYN